MAAYAHSVQSKIPRGVYPGPIGPWNNKAGYPVKRPARSQFLYILSTICVHSSSPPVKSSTQGAEVTKKTMCEFALMRNAFSVFRALRAPGLC